MESLGVAVRLRNTCSVCHSTTVPQVTFLLDTRLVTMSVCPMIVEHRTLVVKQPHSTMGTEILLQRSEQSYHTIARLANVMQCQRMVVPEFSVSQVPTQLLLITESPLEIQDEIMRRY